MLNPSSRQLQPSHLNQQFHGHGLSFAAYIAHMRTIIAQARCDLTPKNQTMIINANAPFESQPNTAAPPTQGMICIHGITDSPFMFSDIAEALKSHPFLIRAPLLPGHGTVPGDLLHISYSAWMEAVRYCIDSMTPTVNSLFLAGFSLGASLALHAAQQSPHVKGLLFFSPTLKIKSKHLLALRLFRTLKKPWLEKAVEQDYTKYTSLASNGAYQAFRYLQAIHPFKIGAQLSLPVFIAICENDFVSDVRTVLTFFKKNTHPHSRLLLYTQRPHSFSDPRIECRPNHYPDARILSLSHVSIPIAPSNPHYGTHGDYKILLAKKGKSADFHYGERNHHKKLQGLLYRLTFNPDFDYMMSAVRDFLERVG